MLTVRNMVLHMTVWYYFKFMWLFIIESFPVILDPFKMLHEYDTSVISL